MEFAQTLQVLCQQCSSLAIHKGMTTASGPLFP
jgi:hypothetical protein